MLPYLVTHYLLVHVVYNPKKTQDSGKFACFEFPSLVLFMTNAQARSKRHMCIWIGTFHLFKRLCPRARLLKQTSWYWWQSINIIYPRTFIPWLAMFPMVQNQSITDLEHSTPCCSGKLWYLLSTASLLEGDNSAARRMSCRSQCRCITF